MRCIFHKWSKWSDKYFAQSYFGGGWWKQRRRCKRCGKIQERGTDD